MNLNVYVPDDLGREFKALTEAGRVQRGFVSGVVQEAITKVVLDAKRTQREQDLLRHLGG